MTKDHKVDFLTAGESTSIYQRGRVWYVNYQTGGRQVRRSLNTNSKKEAILRAQRIDIELRDGGVTNKVAVASIGDVIQAFLEATIAQDRAVKTVAKYRHVCDLIGKLAIKRNIQRPAQLNAQFADALRSQLRQSGKAEKTIYNAMVILRSLTLFAVSRNLCDRDPLAGYKLQKPKPTPQPCWTPAEADAIVEAAPRTYRPYFLFLRETGCRAGEAKFLTWNDVDLSRRQFQIRPKVGWKPKSGDQRGVPMTMRVVELIKSLPRSGPWVFTSPRTPKHPDVRQISERRALQALKRVLKLLNLYGHLHTFRHTFISQALMRNVPEATVRAWVGHVDANILRLYTHVADDVSRSFLDRFSDIGSINNRVTPQGEEESA